MAEKILETSIPGFLPDYWYAGDQGRKPQVRRQYSQSNCWAVASASALEAALLPQTKMSFSPDHFVFRNAFTVDPQKGGSYYMAMAYLSSWQGPVTDEQDPYGDRQSPPGLSPAVHVQEIRLFEEAQERQLKEAVMKYGAVQASLRLDKEETEVDSPYYNEMTAAYYYPHTELQNHDIVILGWDDSYSRFLFREIPQRDGAFICQNSWGEEFGQDGIFYVSYEDANLGVMAAAYSRVEPADNYDRIYQADDCGWQGSLGYGSETCWFANVYTAQEAESLQAAGFYATGKNTRYQVYLAHDFTDTGSFETMELLTEGSFTDAGYYTVDFTQEIPLDPGERFALAVRMKVPHSASPAAAEYAKDADTQNVVLSGKESYLSRTGEEWQNTQEEFAANICLKAYTDLR